MSEGNIGKWFSRGGGRPMHLVDSDVAGDVMTRCGRRMDVTHRPTEWLAEGVTPPNWDRCQQCDAR